MRIYVCSPYRADTPEGVERNVEFARKCCREVFDCGFIPVAPHLFYAQFLDDNNPDDRERGLLQGRADLVDCDQVWVFGERVSEGMAAELEMAELLLKPIVYPDFVKLRGIAPC